MSKRSSPSFFESMFDSIFCFIRLIVRFILQKIYGKKGEKAPPINNPILLDSVSTLAMKIRTREVSSEEVLKAFIDRIQEVNPLLNCVVDNRFLEALKEAKEVDKFIASGTMTPDEIAIKKPLLGVPMSAKDYVAIKGLLFTCGTYHRRNLRAKEDSVAIAKLRAAGAIPFALTNVPELCMWYESTNTIFGRTKNPYDTLRIPGGSSGGEGALQSSGGSAFGIGSDIGGSIRIPAFCNGIFGHKPSRYIVSNEGQYPIVLSDEEKHMLSTGPLCRYACDLIPILKVIVDEKYLKVLRLDEPVDLRKLKIFYQDNYRGNFGVQPVDKDIKEALRKVITHFKDNLKVEVNRVQIDESRNIFEIWKANLEARGVPPVVVQAAQSPNEEIKPGRELLKWMFGKSHHTFVLIGNMIMEKFGVKRGSEKFVQLMNQGDEVLEDFKELLKDENSVFLYPTHPCVAPFHQEAILRTPNISYTALINILGFPSCAIPLGLGSEGLPLGIQCVSNFNNDRLCLAVAVELEKVFGGWVRF